MSRRCADHPIRGHEQGCDIGIQRVAHLGEADTRLADRLLCIAVVTGNGNVALGAAPMKDL